jgi:tRNA threonylcarbamoyladenosine biosynthesis protein TsaE
VDISKYTFHTVDELVGYGTYFAKTCAKHQLILLEGAMGAGKTLFVKAVCQALGVPSDMVTSPTFSLLHYYDGDFAICHADLYRLGTAEEFFLIGGEEALYSYLTFVEWPQIILDQCPEDALYLRFSIPSPTTRQVIVSSLKDYRHEYLSH